MNKNLLTLITEYIFVKNLHKANGVGKSTIEAPEDIVKQTLDEVTKFTPKTKDETARWQRVLSMLRFSKASHQIKWPEGKPRGSTPKHNAGILIPFALMGGYEISQQSKNNLWSTH